MFGKPRELLLRTFRGAFGSDDWTPFLDFVSPSFFDVVPLRGLLGQGRELVANATSREGRVDLESRVAEALRRRGVELELGPGASRSRGLPEGEAARSRGQRVLELYFTQLFACDGTLLDLRPGSFAESAATTHWTPGPYYVRWEPSFLEGLRQVYEGFYGDDDRVFDEGLERLGLQDSKDLFRRHFGGGDARAVRFDRESFVSTFHDVFLRCRDEGVSLHRNFLPLGLYLACLHEHLGQLGGSYDVAEAFARATGDAATA